MIQCFVLLTNCNALVTLASEEMSLIGNELRVCEFARACVRMIDGVQFKLECVSRRTNANRNDFQTKWNR